MEEHSVKIQLHYFFNDETVHSMNAFIRNENEKELLIIFRELISQFEVDIQIESEALAEGGLKNIWKFIGKNEKELKLVGGLLAFLLTAPLVYVQVQNIRLDSQIKVEELRKLKKEAIEDDSTITQEIVDRVVHELRDDYKISLHKSNFYKRTNDYADISKISTVQIDNSNKPIEDERTVFRNDFSKFILRPISIEPVIDEDAVIEIISPVLKSGNFAWRGVYKGQPISFHMKDTEFQNSVLTKKHGFTNGVTIKCVMQLKQRFNEVGVVEIWERNVMTVLEIFDSIKPSEITPQGKKYLRKRDAGANQLGMFPDQEK